MSTAEFNPNCPCTSDCPRHGNCTACRDHHAKTGSLTYCQKHPERLDLK